MNDPGGMGLITIPVRIIGKQIQPGTPLEYELKRPVALIELIIYDQSGRVVRKISLTPAGKLGVQSFTWDGRNNLGEQVSAGYYLLREAMLWVTSDLRSVPADQIATFTIQHPTVEPPPPPPEKPSFPYGIVALAVGAVMFLTGDR